jgi:hypothetical protein
MTSAGAGCTFAFTTSQRSQRRAYKTEFPQSHFADGKSSCDVGQSIEKIRAVLTDTRVPNVGVSAKGNVITVGQVQFTIKGTQLEGAGEDLTKEQFNAALGKLVMLRNVHDQIKMRESLGMSPVVLKEADGSLTVRGVGKTKVDLNRDSQAKFVLEQVRARTNGTSTTKNTLLA